MYRKILCVLLVFISLACSIFLQKPVKEVESRELPPPEVVYSKANSTPDVSRVEGNPTPTQISTRSNVYTIVSGDTLGQIAEKFDVPLDNLEVANNISNPDIIYPGDEITIPNPLETPAVDSIGMGKEIWVDLGRQTLYAYEDAKLLKAFLVSTGLPKTPTPRGEFQIWIKLAKDNMKGGEGSYAYDIEGVPWVMYFKNNEVAASEGYSIHGAFWHNNFGHPMSHGCINLRVQDAEWLFSWAEVDKTKIIIY